MVHIDIEFSIGNCLLTLVSWTGRWLIDISIFLLFMTIYLYSKVNDDTQKFTGLPVKQITAIESIKKSIESVPEEERANLALWYVKFLLRLPTQEESLKAKDWHETAQVYLRGPINLDNIKVFKVTRVKEESGDWLDATLRIWISQSDYIIARLYRFKKSTEKTLGEIMGEIDEKIAAFRG
ncbi:hypothetical protein BDZ45DRAFT_735209 [Acephala macrosclerotiorum]|nr:hypothetical protein BDZ45DRAFT_735209 [Acephala macrosclerotiorum]